MNYEKLWTELKSQLLDWHNRGVESIDPLIFHDVMDIADGTSPPAELIEQRIEEEREYIRENVPEFVEV